MRLSIRDLFLLTAIVALGLGSYVRERQLREELRQAYKWRGRAGALEHVLRDDGWDVKWETSPEVTVSWPRVNQPRTRPYLHVHRNLSTEHYEPSAAPH